MARMPFVLTTLLTCLLASAAAAAFAPREAPSAPAADALPAASAAGVDDDAARSGRLLVLVNHSGSPTDAFVAIQRPGDAAAVPTRVHLVPGANVLLNGTVEAGTYKVRLTLGADAVVLTAGASATGRARVGACDGVVTLAMSSAYRGLNYGVGGGSGACVPREA